MCRVVKIHTQTVSPQLSSILLIFLMLCSEILSSAQSCTAHNSSRTHSTTHTLFSELTCHLRLFFGSVSRSFVTSTDDIISRRLFMWERVLYGKVNGSEQAVSPNRRELSAIWLCISVVKLSIVQVSLVISAVLIPSDGKHLEFHAPQLLLPAKPPRVLQNRSDQPQTVRPSCY